MSSLSINHDENTPAIDRKYWNLRRMFPRVLPKRGNIGWCDCFKLHKEEWRYTFSLNRERFTIFVACISNDAACQFYNVSVGIFGETGDVIVVSKATVRTACDFDFRALVERSKVDSLLQSDELFTFFIEVEKKDQEKIQKSKMLEKKSQTDFRDLLVSGEGSDFTIIVKDKTFACHRLILRTRSPVFSAMMNHEMKEKRNGQLIVRDAEPNVFGEFLLYLYTGSVEYLNWENVTELYKLGHMYEVGDLQHLCAGRIKEGITVENFYEWLLFSQLHNDSELSDFIICIFLENSDHIINSETWIEFQMKYPDEIDVLVKAMDKHRVFLEQRVAPPIIFEKDICDD